MAKKNPSANSAAPIDQQLEQTVRAAGISRKRVDSHVANASQTIWQDKEPMVLPPRGNPTQTVVETMRCHPSKSDPNGSWTGVPENPYEVPVQDADDL